MLLQSAICNSVSVYGIEKIRLHSNILLEIIRNMSDDWSVKNWKPSVTATRAGGMDFQKVTESKKWQEMIRHERPIEMESMMVHIRKWHKQGHLKKHPLGNKLDKLVAQTGGYSTGGHGNSVTDSKVWFPTMGLGPIVPREVKTMEPNQFKEAMSTSAYGTRRFGATLNKTTEMQRAVDSTAPMPDPNLPTADGFNDMPGEPLTTKQLVARMKTMQSELGRLRQTRKNTERTLKKLKKGSSRRRRSQSTQGGTRSTGSLHLPIDTSALALPLRSGSGSGSRSGSSRSERRKPPRSSQSSRSSRSSGRRSRRNPTDIATATATATPSVTSSTPSLESVRSLLDGTVPLGYTQTLPPRATTAVPKSSSRPVSRISKRFSKWNNVLQLWEHHDLSLPRGSTMLNKRDTYHSNNISALFADPTTPGRSIARTTMAPVADLMKMGLLDELDAKQMRLFAVNPKLRANRVMSKLTRFAEHAIKNRLKPFAVGRG